MNKMVKNYIFDLGGVLIEVCKEHVVDAFKEMGVADADRWIDAYKQAGVFADLEKGIITVEEFCQEIRQMAQRDLSNDQIIEAWNRMLNYEIPAWKPELLMRLRQQHKVCLLSNTNSIHWEAVLDCFARSGYRVDNCFDAVFLSYEMHLSKPSPEIFQAAMHSAGLVPGDTMLIDDSPANCEAASALGLSVYCPRRVNDWRSLFE